MLDNCKLCPRECGADRYHGNPGVCAAGSEMRIARIALHFWEEPSISGESGSGTVFFTQCPLRCVYCQNYEISGSEKRGKVYTTEDLAKAFLGLEREGALNINLVTPTHFAPMARESVELARSKGMQLPVIWNTSGYESCEAIRDNEGIVDVYLTDFKYADSGIAKALSNAPDYPDVAMRALCEMVTVVGSPTFDMYHDQERIVRGVVVRHMVLPGHVDDSKNVIKHIWEEFGNDVQYSLMSQYTPVLSSNAEKGNEQAKEVLSKHPELGREISREEYEELLDFADMLGIEDYCWQEPGTAKESFIPDFGQ